jgi:hypothetical protein
MGQKKQAWKAHALDYIKATKKCPGELPPTGSLEELFTHEQFLRMVAASGVHPWDSCCFVEDILGLKDTTHMQEIKVDSRKVLKDAEILKASLGEDDRKKKVALLRDKMHKYVDQIDFKPNGALFVPSRLLHFEEYLKNYFG